MTTVALDLTALRAGATGVARYATALLDQLQARHPDIELRTFSVGRGPEPDRPVDRHVPVPLRVVHRSWQVLRRPTAEQLVGPVDAVHTLDMVPAPSRAPAVLTVHDLNPLRLPHRYEARQIRIARAHLDAARTRVDVVLTTCRSTADEIAELGVPAERIVVAPLGHRPVPGTLPAPVVPPPYLLYVGALTPRKGLDVLVDAVAALPPTLPPLVVAGPDGHGASEVRAAVAGSGAADRVRFLGRVSDEVLDALYAHATVLCHPSEAEGFGIPVLEAMAFGVPLLAGSTPQAHELAGDGDAGVLVAPRDVGAWTAAIEALLADEGERARLGRRGVERARDWTWERCGDVVAGVYRTIQR